MSNDDLIPIPSGIKNNLLLFQPINAGGEAMYLVYMAPAGETDGDFIQEEGGVIWISADSTQGVPCETAIISKALGDRFMWQDVEAEQTGRRIERR